MSTRRSARVRARDDDNETTSEATAAAVHVATPAARPPQQAKPKTKRSRLNERQESMSSDANTNWLNHRLPQDKRAEWDRVMKSAFFLEKPTDVYDLYELAAHLSPENPQDAFVATTGIRLIGPFDLLARSGSTVVATKPMHLHGRFFLDPPEVVSIAEDVTSKAGAHWGLFRDRPSQSPAFIVHARDASVCSFDPVAWNLFHLLRERLETRPDQNDPSTIQQLRLITSYIKRTTTGLSKTPSSVQYCRSRDTLATSLHGLGIVVPYDTKKRSGYRELSIAGQTLQDLITQVQDGDAGAKKKLANLITRATIANDECDFGTSLLLGLDLFTAGSALQKEALQMLRVAYMLLGSKEFAKVASDHIKHRTQIGDQPHCCIGQEEITADATGVALQLP